MMIGTWSDIVQMIAVVDNVVTWMITSISIFYPFVTKKKYFVPTFAFVFADAGMLITIFRINAIIILLLILMIATVIIMIIRKWT